MAIFRWGPSNEDAEKADMKKLRLPSQISKLSNYLTLNISETLRDTDTME